MNERKDEPLDPNEGGGVLAYLIGALDADPEAIACELHAPCCECGRTVYFEASLHDEIRAQHAGAALDLKTVCLPCVQAHNAAGPSILLESQVRRLIDAGFDVIAIAMFLAICDTHGAPGLDAAYERLKTEPHDSPWVRELVEAAALRLPAITGMLRNWQN